MNVKKALKMSITAALFLLILMIPACSGGKKIQDENKIITINVFPDLDKAYTELIEEFKIAYPEYEVKLNVAAWGDHHNTLMTKLATEDEVPDVCAVDVNYLGQLSGAGGFENLMKKPYDAGRYKNQFVEYAWNQAAISKKEVIGIPVDIGPGCAFYRKDILDSVGVNYDTDIKSMEDLFNLGAKVSKDLDGDGDFDQWLVADAKDIFHILFRSDETRYFDKKGRPVLNRPLIKTAMMWTKKIYDAGYSADINQWSPQWFAALSTEKGGVVYTPTGAWMTGHLKNWMAPKLAGKYRVGHLPALEKGSSKPMYASWGGTFLSIPANANTKAGAWKLIEFIACRPESQIKSFEVSATFPSLKAVMEDPVFQQPVKYLGNQQARRLWVEVAENVPLIYTNKKDAAARGILITELEKVLYEGKSIEDAVNDAQAEAEKQIEY